MSLGRYLLGAGEIALIAIAVYYGAMRLRARLLPSWSGSPARLAEVVLATSALLVSAEVLGVAHILDPAPIIAAAVIAGALMAWFGSPLDESRVPKRPIPAQMGPPATAVALVVIFIVAMHWAAISQHSFAVGMYGGDENWYHLPYAARFAQDGAITALHYASPSYLSWFHPVNSELIQAVGMVLTGRDILSPFLNLLWLGVALLAAWCIGRPFGVAPLTATATALAVDLPVFAGTQAGAAMSDLFGVTMLLAAVAILLTGYEAPEGEPRRFEPKVLVVAGLAAGLSMGAKLGYAAPAVVLTACVIFYSPGGRRRASALLWVLPVLLTGSYWYVRNFVHTLNPFPYVSKLGPIDLPGPNEGLNGGPPYTVAHYLGNGTVWSEHLAPGFSAQLGPLWPLLIGVALAGIVLGIAQRRSPVIRMLGILGAALFVFWLFAPAAAEGPEGNPTSFPAGLRVLEPALIVGLVLAMVSAARLGDRWRWGVLAAVAIVALVATRRGLSFWDSAGQLGGAVLIAAALILLPLAVIAAARRGGTGRLAAAASVLVVVVAGVALAWPRTQYYFDHRYRTADVPPLFKILNMVPLYRWASGVHDQRIGTSGILQYGLYGDDLSNRVQFLGKVGSDHSFREISNCAAWRKTINVGGYDYVVAMPRFGGSRELQARWTRGPHAKQVLHSAPITVFRITGKLNPKTCGTLPRL